MIYGFFTIPGFIPGATISIADMNGQEVYHVLKASTTARIDLGHCRPGVYLVTCGIISGSAH
ncbi:MAG: hypothetical protein ACOCX8_00885 [Bacteroidota bacterium]